MKRYNFDDYKSLSGWVIRIGLLCVYFLMAFGFIALVERVILWGS